VLEKRCFNDERRARHISRLSHMPATDSSQIANASDSIEETSDAMSKLRMADLPPGHHRGRTILCPVVDDDASSAAVEWALDNVWRDKQDTIHLLCILPTRYENTGYVYPMVHHRVSIGFNRLTLWSLSFADGNADEGVLRKTRRGDGTQKTIGPRQGEAFHTSAIRSQAFATWHPILD